MTAHTLINILHFFVGSTKNVTICVPSKTHHKFYKHFINQRVNSIITRKFQKHNILLKKQVKMGKVKIPSRKPWFSCFINWKIRSLNISSRFADQKNIRAGKSKQAYYYQQKINKWQAFFIHTSKQNYCCKITHICTYLSSQFNSTQHPILISLNCRLHDISKVGNIQQKCVTNSLHAKFVAKSQA